MNSLRFGFPFLCWALLSLQSCAAGPVPEAYDNRVFYERGAVGASEELRQILEKPHPALDGESDLGRDFVGVEILDGVARFSRPKDWVIRRGSVESQGRFIEYVSPRQVVFTLYERLESPREPWGTVLERYEKETKEQGAQLQGKAVPFATYNNQARSYEVRRGIPAGKEPFVNYSREYLARSQDRIVLVQIVRPRKEFGEAESELLHVMKSLRVL